VSRPHIHDSGVVEVTSGKVEFGIEPALLVAPALGSCVGVVLYDPVGRCGGIAHVMLPTTSDSAAKGHPGRFADRAIPMLVEGLEAHGSPRDRLTAKIAGGAAMFGHEGAGDTIGTRNAAEVRRQLAALGIPIRGSDTGGHHARTVELHLESGLVVVRSYAHGTINL
jgi:chemotaxis protein CheD